jgi:hypothetical protein
MPKKLTLYSVLLSSKVFIEDYHILKLFIVHYKMLKNLSKLKSFKIFYSHLYGFNELLNNKLKLISDF